MTAAPPSLANLKPNPDWAKLPLFDRTEWKRVRFGDVVENLNETCDPAEAGLDRFIAMEHLEPGSLHVRSWGDVADGTTFTRRCRPGQVNNGCFPDLGSVPVQAITLTYPTLMAAKALVCVAPGAHKAAAVKATLNDPVSPSCPATILRSHPNAVLYLDKASASLL